VTGVIDSPSAGNFAVVVNQSEFVERDLFRLHADLSDNTPLRLQFSRG